MAGGKNKIHEHENHNTNGFAQNPENAKKGGRRPSIKKELELLALQDGSIEIPKSQIVSINDDGSVVIKLPKQEMLAMKLYSWAMSKKGGDSIKAIQMIMEQFDGKALQRVEDVTPPEDTAGRMKRLEELGFIMTKEKSE